MDWVRGVLGGGGRAAGDPNESATLLPSVARDASVVREMSFADILAASQQQPPLEPEVVKQPGRAVVRARDAATAGLDGAKPAADGTEEVILTVDAGSRQPGPQLGSLPASNAPRERPAPLPNSTRAAVRATAYGVTNLASVVAIVFANKLVLFTHGFHFAATLTLMHCIFTSLGMAVLASVGFFEVKRVPLARSVPVAAVYVGTIVLNNLSIQLNTVGFYQVSKIAITPVIVVIEWVFYARPASRRVLASVCVLLTGIFLATVTDSQVSGQPLGVAVAAANCVITGLYQVWAGTKQRELGLSGLQLLHQVSPPSVLLLALLVPTLEPIGWGPAPGPDTVLGYQLTPPAAFWIVISSVLGLVVTLSTFLFIGATSSLTYNVVGHLKTVMIVSGGVFLFGDSMTAKKLLGLLVAMSGIVWYSHIKLAEAAAAPAAAGGGSKGGKR